jgi:hypothetical protein
MNANRKTFALAVLLALVSGQVTAKPENLSQATASFTAPSTHPFAQEFLVTTAKGYDPHHGSIFISASSAQFNEPLTIDLYAPDGTNVSGRINAQNLSGNLVASFSDSASTYDLIGGTDYRLVVSGSAKSAGSSLGITGSYFTSISTVPEPGSYLVWLAGLGAICAVALRRGYVR